MIQQEEKHKVSTHTAIPEITLCIKHTNIYKIITNKHIKEYEYFKKKKSKRFVGCDVDSKMLIYTYHTQHS